MRARQHTAARAKAHRLAARPSRREGQASRHDALERWDWEGGAAALGPSRPERAAPHCTLDFAGTEMAQLRMRVVALENLMLTLRAAARMVQMVERASTLHVAQPRH
jgi:hypothetical protein